jgi:hypothetical protein
VWRFERHLDFAVTPEGPTKVVDYTLDTRVVNRAVKAACAAAGIRAAVRIRVDLDEDAAVGIIFAVGGCLTGVLWGIASFI